MEEPLQLLRAALLLDAEIDSAQREVMLAAARAYFQPGQAAGNEFQAAVRKLRELVERYAKMPLSPEERRTVETLRQLQDALVDYTNRYPGTNREKREAVLHFRQLRDINLPIDSLQKQLAQAHLARLETLTAQLHEYTRRLYLLLAAFGLFAVLSLLEFRRRLRREIWEPLEDLRRLVMEIRKGNLNVRGEVPRSLEFGPLVSGFLDMAGELRKMRDALERKVRERTEQLEATQRELVQTAKLSSLGQVVSGVAHEINNPLTSILGFSELALGRMDLDPQLRTQLHTIRDEAVRLKTLVANLNASARREPQRTARVDLRSALDRLVDLRRYQLTTNNVELHYDRPLRPAWVEADRDQLVQVLFNLVLNAEQAIQATPDRGDIWLACGSEGGLAWATVRDNGPGMSPEIRERIFDPFFTTKAAGQGTGLGLSISHGIIRQHHGTLVAKSVEGQGTTIRITLPAHLPKGPASELAPEPAVTPAADKTGATPRRCAMVIDDEPAITQLLAQFLESSGWDSVVLNDSTQVEAALDRQPFDLVICDLKMPRLNGLDVLRLLRQKRPELAQHFLLMTGHLIQNRHKESVELAGIPVLSKPFTLARLAEALEALVSRQQ